MIIGMSLSAFTTLHVILSLVAMLAGIVVLIGMLTSVRLGFWAALFLATAILTSATGYLVPVSGLLPSHIVGAISLVALVLAAWALYSGKLEGKRRWAYVIGVTLAVYLDVFVGVVQAFQKIALLHALAPTQTEAPFAIIQLVVLAIFVIWGVLALLWFKPEQGAARFAAAAR
jgi:hypothetical protein